MNELNEIINNQALVSGFLAWFFAQFIKMALALMHGVNRKAFQRFWSSGGFPSSHAASVTALAAACGIIYGLGSASFAIAAVFALVVIYDAFTVRQEAGKHAEVLNRIMEDIYLHKKFEFDRLKELLGHTRFEAFFGLVLGIVVAIIVCR